MAKFSDRRQLRAVVLILLVLLIGQTTACGAIAEPALPTLRPTVTETLEPSLTPTRVFNATPTATPMQVAAAPTQGPSPTPIIGATPTRPRYTLTPTLQGIVFGLLQIEYFTTSATTIKPGDRITLFWSVKGTDKATIYRLDSTGKRQQLWNVGRAGSLEVPTRTADRDVVQFLISIGDDNNHLEQTVAIPIGCTEPWFFEPQPEACPAAPPTLGTQVEQTFERGRMIWVQAQSRIYVLFNDGQRPAWAYYTDEFKDGQPESDPSLSPPSGLLQPIRGFGLIWRGRERVRERLGWATSAEQAYDGAFQGDGTVESGVMYIRSKDGNILSLADRGISWTLIKP
jgi:hypothetical protein